MEDFSKVFVRGLVRHGNIRGRHRALEVLKRETAGGEHIDEGVDRDIRAALFDQVDVLTGNVGSFGHALNGDPEAFAKMPKALADPLTDFLSSFV